MIDHAAMESLLNDYVDGSLDPEKSAELEAHLDGCSACRGEVAALRALLAEAARLERSIEPPRDLWPDIDVRIDSSFGASWLQGRSVWSVRYQLAAAAVIIVAISSAITAVLLSERPSPESTNLPTAALESPSAVSLIAQWRATEREYLWATAELIETLEAVKSSLPPEAVALIENNLRIIDEAIRESRATLALDPTNREMMESLSAVYEKKLEVLLQVHRLSSEL